MRKALLNLTFIGVGTLLGIVGTQFSPLHAQSERTPPKVVVDDTEVQRDGKFTTSFAPVVKKVAPSVVSIFASRTLKPSEAPDMRRMHPFFNDPTFREFFGDPGQRPSRRQREEALGSGVVVSEDGYILTSNHVIEEADEIKVELLGGRELTAKVIGTDPATDTAVIKVDATGLAAATLANSDKLEVGDVALAIGNPFGIGQTVTMGIISATGRGDLGIVAYEDFIQTDASINMGNSGGALVDAQGHLIGINTAILSRTGGNQGVGFAIPINMGRMVMERLIADGKVTRGYLGVSLQPLTPELAERLEIKEQGGALVNDVVEGTPAAEAGMKPGDLVTEFDGRKVADYRQLRLMVSQTKPNSKATFKVLRDGKFRNVEVTLAELPSQRAMAGMMRPGGAPENETKPETLEGVEVGDIDAKARRQYNIPNHLRGALVTNVDPNSNAYSAGLRPGDVLLEIERKAVADADEAVERSNNFRGSKVLLRVWSRGSAKYLFVPVGGNEQEQEEQPETAPRGEREEQRIRPRR
ncbi:MAG: DegQ family serine endoprotease [Limisphaerales bacterium]